MLPVESLDGGEFVEWCRDGTYGKEGEGRGWESVGAGTDDSAL